MRKTLVFASRNTKEILRDVLTLFFGVLFPVVILLLLSAINASIPKEAEMNLFDIENLVPGIAVFGFSFMSLFSATLVSKDRCTSFILRLFTSPLKSSQYIVGYTLPLLPMAIVQSVLCYIVALVLGLEFSANIILAIVANIPAMVLFIALGLLCGTLFNDKAVGGVCGALLTNLTAWLSGTWFDLKLVGGAFEKIANLLPFTHAVNAGRYALSGEYSLILPELLWVSAYAICILIIAVLVFSIRMKQDK
ncbi:MAG: ABC transporter permease [Ruminococcaceae bacterium]|nr:ABC transporter permease [Oscillospiraceae bacterium]